MAKNSQVSFGVFQYFSPLNSSATYLNPGLIGYSRADVIFLASPSDSSCTQVCYRTDQGVFTNVETGVLVNLRCNHCQSVTTIPFVYDRLVNFNASFMHISVYIDFGDHNCQGIVLPPEACGILNCDACCSCRCFGSNPSYHGSCNGTSGSGGCEECHDVNSECDCGACCYCKCTCMAGAFADIRCHATCAHDCPGVPPCYHELDGMTWTHCECHHEGGGGGDDDGECCEHHEKIVEELEKIRGALGGDGTIIVPGGLSAPGAFIDPGPLAGFLNPNLPGAPSFTDIIGPPAPVARPSLRFFNRPEVDEGFSDFELQQGGIFSDFKSAVQDKIPLDRLGDLAGAPSSGLDSSWNWIWRIEFDWAGVHYGPWVFDFEYYIDVYAQSAIGGFIRLLILFYVVAVFLFQVTSLFFEVA